MAHQICKEYYDAKEEEKKKLEGDKNDENEKREIWKYGGNGSESENEEEVKKEESKKEESKKEETKDEESKNEGVDVVVDESAATINKAHGIPHIVKRPPTPKLNPQKLSPKLSQSKSNGLSESAHATTNSTSKML